MAVTEGKRTCQERMEKGSTTHDEDIGRKPQFWENGFKRKTLILGKGIFRLKDIIVTALAKSIGRC